MKHIIFLASLTVFALFSCKPMEEDTRVSQKWSAQDIFDSWTYEHQDTSTVKPYWMDGNVLCIRTRAETYDRAKLCSKQIYTYGTYRWKTYIPEFGEGDMTSVGSWIYCDDQHEIDFEVGYGKKEERQKAGVGAGEYLAYMTCQQFPYTSTAVRITPGWHEFSIILGKGQEDNYTVDWMIDNSRVKHVNTGFGATDARFRIFVSVENLKFIGDHIPAQDNIGKFEWVSFEGETINK